MPENSRIACADAPARRAQIGKHGDDTLASGFAECGYPPFEVGWQRH